MPESLTDYELRYAATERCRCGAGLACPLDTDRALKLRMWACSAVLKGEETGEHDGYPFALYKIREEGSINNRGGFSTRPPGTVCRTIGKALCPSCQYEWQSEPYNANGLGHHWFSGPCPSCGYAVGGGGLWSSGEGEPIKLGYQEVVLKEQPDA